MKPRVAQTGLRQQALTIVVAEHLGPYPPETTCLSFPVH